MLKQSQVLFIALIGIFFIIWVGAPIFTHLVSIQASFLSVL